MNLGERWRRIWLSDKTKAASDLEQWVQDITTDDIRLLFLNTLKEGNNVLVPAIKSTELDHFHKVVAGLDLAPNGQIQMVSIIRYLTQAHAPKADVIQSTTSTIGALIVSHAHFPFSVPVGLTEDSFCRAILLLTHRCQEPFRQAEGYGSGGAFWEKIRKRPDERRLKFLQSALLKPQTGVPTHDDILDVVCRVKYPQVRQKKQVRGRPVSDFLPLAERLEPSGDTKDLGSVPVSQLQPLRDIVAAFPPQRSELVVDLGFADQGSLGPEEFVQWATNVQLLESLDQLFGVFLCPAPTKA